MTHKWYFCGCPIEISFLNICNTSMFLCSSRLRKFPIDLDKNYTNVSL